VDALEDIMVEDIVDDAERTQVIRKYIVEAGVEGSEMFKILSAGKHVEQIARRNRASLQQAPGDTMLKCIMSYWSAKFRKQVKGIAPGFRGKLIKFMVIEAK
jgi:hypothetical protein